MDALNSVLQVARSLPMDYVIIGCAFLVLAIDALRAGDGRVTTLALAAPISSFAYSALSHAAFIPGVTKSSPMVAAGAFVGVLFVVFILVRRMTFFGDSGGGRPIQELLAVLAALSILLLVWATTPALATIWKFGPLISSIFSASYALYILAASFIALAIARS